MNRASIIELKNFLNMFFKPHPWHGVSIGSMEPKMVNAFIEIVPTDTIKYEMDKETGYLKVDRPQKFSNVCPALYGFIPQTYCGDLVAEYSNKKTGRTDLLGDEDALDICVLAEKMVTHGDIILKAIPIGGYRMIDGDEADDKILAVLPDDAVFGNMKEIDDCPASVVDRLKHYFLTYKEIPAEVSSKKSEIEITHIYGAEEAMAVIEKSHKDYTNKFDFPKVMGEFLTNLT